MARANPIMIVRARDVDLESLFGNSQSIPPDAIVAISIASFFCPVGKEQEAWEPMVGKIVFPETAAA